jgi:hypothetical protein
MFLLILLLLMLLLFGAGFTAHILWWGLIIGLIVLVAEMVSGGGWRRW